MNIGTREATTIHVIRSGAYSGAAVWAVYGIVETAFAVLSPWLRKALAAVAPGMLPTAYRSDFISPALTALVLVLYPVMGALLGAAVALVFALTTVGRRVLAKADEAMLLTSVGCLTLALALGVIALLEHHTSFLPAVLASIGFAIGRLAAACRPHRRSRWLDLTHPLNIVVMLVGTTFIAFPRWHLSTLAQGILEISYTGAILVAMTVLFRVWASTPTFRLIERGPLGSWAGILLLSCAVLALNVLAEYTPRRSPYAQVQPHAPDGRPNVILITLDTVRADHLSVYGYSRDTTPNLLRLAATRATLYTRAFASCNWTFPSHASILTGQSPRRNGAHESSLQTGRIYPLSRQSITLPERLSQIGYTTAGIVANFGVLGGGYGIDRGFAFYDTVEPKDLLAPVRGAYLLRAALRDEVQTILHNHPVFSRAEIISERAVELLKSMDRTHQPFFLFLNYMDAHAPYLPPPPFDTRFVDRRPERPLSNNRSLLPVSQYDGAIAYMDDQLAQLFEKLSELSLFENSLIIIVSDHGEAFGESSFIGHGISLYQHQVFVPLIVKYPHEEKGGTVDALVSDVDILPTVLDVIGAPVPPNIEGRSLRRAEPLDSRWVTSESYRSRGLGWTSKDERPTEMALFSGTLKLILGAGGGTELYDLSTDPNEHVNLFGRRAIPKEWISKLAADMDEAGVRTGTSPVTDPELLDRLRALGYIR